jgi:hypothetical protein
MANKLSLFFLSAFFCGLSNTSHAQIATSGSVCAVSGSEIGYLYTATGDFQNADNLSWKITGGVIAGTNSNSFEGSVSATGAQVRIVWNRGINNGKIKVSSRRLGSSELTVNIISFPNSISVSNGVIRTGATVTILGSEPSFTVCKPLCNYWWESAAQNSGPFEEISGATGRSLSFNAVAGKRYYRRALSVNGDVLYSNIISIDPQ